MASVLTVPEYAWVELDDDLGRELWRDFVGEFGFSRTSSPAINEPVPSVVWALPPCGTPGAPFPEAARPVAQLVCDVLRECVEYWDSVFHHDAVHPSSQYRPHRVTNVDDLDEWEYSHYPNGDYMIFVSKDHAFGVLGDHFEKTICFFGAPAVTAAIALNDGVLTSLIRRDGKPTAELGLS
ncbi:DUF2716 domain-containing protein [Lentzea sp. NPDC054927]